VGCREFPAAGRASVGLHLVVIVLSCFQTQAVLSARRAGQTAMAVSLDLGLTKSNVILGASGVRMPDGQTLAWNDLEAIDASERGCFIVEDGVPRKIQFFSEEMNCLYSLMPTAEAPTMLISGIPMHRIKDIGPMRDTLLKIRTISPVKGPVLDTATGLGYTAIQAAETAEHVTTVEIEPVALEVARLNPWSLSLFESPNITQIVGDVAEEIEAFEDEAFARILHDPPAFNIAGELYSGALYRQLFRVLRRDGRLFHYIGNLKSSSGRTVSRGAVRRLQEAGFSRVVRRPEAFGLVAYK
jgi:predicted methyltransferase